MIFSHMLLTDRQQHMVDYLKNLREKIIAEFQIFDQTAVMRKLWSYEQGEGGGEIGLFRGRHFEKAAVNMSVIKGDRFPMDDAAGNFFATGISLITHMTNPHAPTVHFNLRFIETKSKHWFGGGFDLTPMGFFYKEDQEHFHGVAKNALDKIDRALYPKFSEAAKNYFYIPHRKKERGVGGIFFDHLQADDNADIYLWKNIGDVFLSTIMPIYHRRIGQDYNENDRQKQLEFRAHYVEFNLLYDRGTKFGFLSGGNPEAILCSMPPLAAW